MLKSKTPLRLMAWLLAGLLFVLSGQALGLGVGPIQTMSNLHQPLVADIPLSQIGDLDETQIKVKLAERKYYKKAGIYQASWLSDIKFTIIKNSNQDGYIQVRSSKPIKDPVVDLLINVSWPNGKMIRQYTILLDPLELTAHAPYASERKASVKQINKKLAKETTASESKPFPVRLGGHYGPTKPEENLWQIANQMVRNTRYTVSQGVLSIYQKNPNAFKNQNINQLKEGEWLSLPTRDDIENVPVDEASAIIASSPKPKASNQEVVITKTASSSGLMNKPLKILSPIDSSELGKKKSSNFYQSGNSFTENASETDQKIALLAEELETLKRKNELIHLENKELKNQNQELLQVNSNAQESDQKSITNQTTHALPTNSSKPAVSANQSQNIKTSSVITGTETQVDLTGEIPQGLVKKSQTNWFAWITLVLAGFGVCGFILYRRQQQQMAFVAIPDALPEDQVKQQETDESKTNTSDTQEVVNYGLDFDLDQALSTVNLPQDLEAENNERLNAKFDYEALKRTYRERLEDIEVLIAYENYQEAEIELTQILEDAPKHWLALLKLLEIFVVTNQYNKFLQRQSDAPEMLATIEPDIWSKIQFLKEKIQEDSIVDMTMPNTFESENELDTQDNFNQNEESIDENVPEYQPDLNTEEDGQINQWISEDNPVDKSEAEQTQDETIAYDSTADKPKLEIIPDDIDDELKTDSFTIQEEDEKDFDSELLEEPLATQNPAITDEINNFAEDIVQTKESIESMEINEADDQSHLDSIGFAEEPIQQNMESMEFNETEVQNNLESIGFTDEPIQQNIESTEFNETEVHEKFEPTYFNDEENQDNVEYNHNNNQPSDIENLEYSEEEKQETAEEFDNIGKILDESDILSLAKGSESEQEEYQSSLSKSFEEDILNDSTESALEALKQRKITAQQQEVPEQPITSQAEESSDIIMVSVPEEVEHTETIEETSIQDEESIQKIQLDQKLSDLENLNFLTKDDSSLIELAKAFILANEYDSARKLLSGLLTKCDDPKHQEEIENILDQIQD